MKFIFPWKKQILKEINTQINTILVGNDATKKPKTNRKKIVEKQIRGQIKFLKGVYGRIVPVGGTINYNRYKQEFKV